MIKQQVLHASQPVIVNGRISIYLQTQKSSHDPTHSLVILIGA
jgi:hypothetical protein